MGFNKKYINEEKIKEMIQNQGMDYLVNFIQNSDLLIMEDDFSEKFCDDILNGEKK